MKYTRILGTGGYLPNQILTNAELERRVDTSDAWIWERTGIRERRIAAPDETTCMLAEQAARRALAVADVMAGDIDLIIVATTTPDQVFPSTACLLQRRLRIQGCPAFDIQAVCTGFVYALSVADKFVRSGEAHCVLVVGAETLSRIVDWTDRSTCVLFGDGAGAVVLGAAEQPGIYSTRLYADGQYEPLLTVATGAVGGGDQGRAYIRMQGREVFKVAVNTMGTLAEETLRAHDMHPIQVDWLVPHQANARIIEATAKKLGLPMERVILTIAGQGNTSAASIPLALDVAIHDGRIKRGDTLLLEAFGAGFTWGSALIRY